MLQADLQLSVTLEKGGISLRLCQEIGVAHSGGQLGQLVFPAVHLGKDRQHLLIECARRMKVGDLGQVANCSPLREVDAALIGSQLTAEQVQ